MKKLTVRFKLILSNLALGLPIVVLMYLLYQSASEQIVFAQQELRGVEYQRPLMSLLNETIKYKLNVGKIASGDETLKSSLSEIEANFDKSLNDLISVNSSIGEALEFTSEGLGKRKRDALTVDNLKGLWTTYKDSKNTLTPEQVDEKLQAIIAHIRGMVVHMGDTSFLILDPDLDSYYLMDVTLLAVPQAMDRNQETYSYINTVIKSKNAGLNEKLKIGVYQALMDADWVRTRDSSNTSISEDQNFYGTLDAAQKDLPSTLAKVADEFKKVNETLGGVVQAADFTITTAQTHAVMSSLNDQYYQYWVLGANVLESFLNTRIESYKSKRTNILVISLIALVIGSIFSQIIGQQIIGSVKEAVQKVQTISNQVRQFSTEFVKSFDEVAQTSLKQASAVQETVASLDEINAMVAKGSDNAQVTSQISQSSNKLAQEGSHVINDMIEAMNKISEANGTLLKELEENNKRIYQIVDVINEVSQKTQVINDIVFQTKLLSFNASVEAARAGESGKGFAVVAEEVGNLAAMSGNAAKEIADMVNNSIGKVKEVAEVTKSNADKYIEEGRQKLQHGITMASRCGEVFSQVAENINKVDNLMGDLKISSQEQTQGVNNIAQAMNHIDESVQANSEMTQKTKALSEGLANQMGELEETIQTFKKDLLG